MSHLDAAIRALDLKLTADESRRSSNPTNRIRCEDTDSTNN